ncbi:alpha/beta fold hydrolase [Oceanobacillus piezotolerans]|uniref:alpha/beta fold hydrolase n=1 Tax=Oceanobacillus piezotolerans TaxID=2448030 RepID=UPI001FE82042|nr:alpha/beta fold hydrolase [Oceanobacillus piezotolerans]
MKKRYIILLLLMLLGSIFILYVPNKVKSEYNLGVPTVFVHGYKGTYNSFTNLLDRFEANGWGEKRIVYYVSSDGRIHDYYTEGSNPAYIQIILQNNRASFANSTEWLSKALRHLKKKYGVETVNLVGHSMGGIISTKYTIEYKEEAYPNVNKLITIGSPFDGIYSEEYFRIHHDAAAEDLKPNSLALEMLYRSDFPDRIAVLNIGSSGDAISFPDSVKAISKIVPKSQLKEVIIEDEDLGHSALHENTRVDKLIRTFLW